MPKSKTHFPQVPVEVAKKAAEEKSDIPSEQNHGHKEKDSNDGSNVSGNQTEEDA